MRHTWISMSFSWTCLMYNISRTNTSVSIKRITVFFQLLLIKLNMFLAKRWSASSASHRWTKNCVSNPEQEGGKRYVSICCNHNLIIMVKFEQFQRQSFSSFLFWLFLRKLSAISVKSPCNKYCEPSPLSDLVPSVRLFSKYGSKIKFILS